MYTTVHTCDGEGDRLELALVGTKRLGLSRASYSIIGKPRTHGGWWAVVPLSVLSASGMDVVRQAGLEWRYVSTSGDVVRVAWLVVVLVVLRFELASKLHCRRTTCRGRVL